MNIKYFIINRTLFFGLLTLIVSCLQAPEIENDIPTDLAFETTEVTAIDATIEVKIRSKKFIDNCWITLSTSNNFEDEDKIFRDYTKAKEGDLWTMKIKATGLKPTTTYYYKMQRINDSNMDGFPDNNPKTFETKAMQKQILSWVKDYSTVRIGQELDLSVTSNLGGNVPVRYTFEGLMSSVSENIFIPMSVGEIEITAYQDGTSSGYPATITKTINVIVGNEQYNHNEHVGIYMGVDTQDGGKIYWSPYNVGAKNIRSGGSYYMWGLYEEQEIYTEIHCPTTYLTYDELLTEGYINQNGELIKNDVATAYYGNNWRTPTVDELKDLMSKCTYRFISDFHVAMLTSTVNGNSLYFPASGYKQRYTVYQNKEMGYYWTATPNPNSTGTYAFEVDKSEMYIKSAYRYNGFNVRPIFVVYPQ